MIRSGADSLRFTLDTNILVYSVDDKDHSRHDLAIQIVDAAIDVDCWLTLQSLSEFYSVVTRKRVMPSGQAATLARQWLTVFPSVPVSADAVRAALVEAVARRASYWDALLVATAAEAGCTVILTEDLAGGTTLGGVAVHNPFDPAGGLTTQARQLLGL